MCSGLTGKCRFWSLDPPVPADIMLTGFRAGCAGFKDLVNNANADSERDVKDMPEFPWGDDVEAARECTSHMALLKRPTRKSAPRYVSPSQSPTKPASKSEKIKDKGGGPQSPGQVKFWYAAKGTSRPGAYVYKHVAESYKINGKGTVKRFKSLADARDWLQMPAPRMFYEQTVRQEAVNDTTSQEAEEFFAIKGGSRSGAYFNMTDAVQAKSEGDDIFGATFRRVHI